MQKYIWCAVQKLKSCTLQGLWLTATLEINFKKTTTNWILNLECDDLSVSIWLPICMKVHSIQMMNLRLISWNNSNWAEFPCKTDISGFFIYFFLLPLYSFSPHRLTSHLWISHGLADNSWSPFHGPAAFNMNYKKASQAYQWMTDWICMAWGQRGVRAQWFPHSVNPRTGNTSVAQGRLFHQHNVWHCLRQMLCWDVLLTFTPFRWETQACWFNTGIVHNQKNLSYVLSRSGLAGKKTERRIFSGHPLLLFVFSSYLILDFII